MAQEVELLSLAAGRLEAPVRGLIVTDGLIRVTDDSANSVSYGELIGGRRFDVTITATGYQRNLEVAPEVQPKSYRDYKIVGTSVPRVDLPAKSTGEYTYAPAVRVPDMLHGRPVRPHTAVAEPSLNQNPPTDSESLGPNFSIVANTTM